MSLKTAWSITKQTFKEFGEDRAMRLSAAMAYYSIFSIGPLLVLMVGVAGLVLGEDRVRQEVTQQLQGMVGQKSAEMVESMMNSRSSGGSLIATIVGGVALLFGAAGVFGQLQDALNTIWEVKAKPGAGIWGFIRHRFFSLSMVLGIGFLLLVSMVLSAVVTAFAGYLGNMISLPEWVAHLCNELASLLVVTVLFAMIFKLLPDVKIRWRDVWIGAFLTALLFTIGKFGLGWYLGRESTASAYGAGSAFVLVLLYIYYSSLILFLGAEFTQVYVNYKGTAIQPSEYAVPVSEGERAQQGMPREQKKPAGKHQDRPAAGRSSPSRTAPAYAQAHAGHSSEAAAAESRKLMHSQSKNYSPADGPRRSPGRQVKAQPWSFVGLALGAGLAAGVLMRFKLLRKALRVYLVARRFI